MESDRASTHRFTVDSFMAALAPASRKPEAGTPVPMTAAEVTAF